MDDTIFKRIRRLATCHIESLTAAQAKDLCEAINAKVKPDAPQTEPQPNRGKRHPGATG